MPAPRYFPDSAQCRRHLQPPSNGSSTTLKAASPPGQASPLIQSVNTMKIAVRLSTLLLCLAILPAGSLAQNPQDARITVSHPGFQTLKKDLKSVLDLTTATEQKQWSNIEDFIDTFVAGVDYERPFQVQLLPGFNPMGYLITVPLDGGFQTFRDNIEGLGYELTRDPADVSLYQFNMQVDSEQTQDAASAEVTEDLGWMKVLSDVNYLMMASTSKRANLPRLKEFCLQSGVQEIATDGKMLLEMINSDATAAAQKYRREVFANVRNPAMDSVKKRPDETAVRFEMRQLSTKLMMDEAERLAAESDKLTLALTFDSSKKDAPALSISGDLTAIPDSGLASAVALFNSQPDLFATVKKFPGSALSIRINHPVDPMRQTGMSEFLDLLQKEINVKLKDSKTRPASEKEAIDKVVTQLVQHVKSAIQSGWINLMTEAVPDGKGNWVTVVGYASPTASSITTILPEMAKMHKGSTVEMNVDKVGVVDIHHVKLGEGLLDVFDRHFGTDRDVYVGVGADQIWLGSGEGALEALRKTITNLGAPEKTSSPLHVELTMLPWARQLVDFYSRQTPPKDREALNLWRSAERQRARAVEAFEKGGDTLVLDAQVKDSHVLTSLTVDTGILRFVGKQMAAFSRENLEAE